MLLLQVLKVSKKASQVFDELCRQRGGGRPGREKFLSQLESKKCMQKSDRKWRKERERDGKKSETTWLDRTYVVMHTYNTPYDRPRSIKFLSGPVVERLI